VVGLAYSFSMAAGVSAAGQGGREMARIARTALHQAQAAAVVALCLVASLALPLTLAAIGFQTL